MNTNMTKNNDETNNEKWQRIMTKILHRKKFILIHTWSFVMFLRRLSSKFQAFCQAFCRACWSSICSRLVSLSLSLPLSVSLAFSSSQSSLCPRLQYGLAPPPRPHSLRWQQIWHKALRKRMAKIRRKSAARNINIWWTMKNIWPKMIDIRCQLQQQMTNRSMNTDKIKY